MLLQRCHLKYNQFYFYQKTLSPFCAFCGQAHDSADFGEPTACQVDPAVSSDFSSSTTSFMPPLARWYAKLTPTHPPPMITVSAVSFHLFPTTEDASLKGKEDKYILPFIIMIIIKINECKRTLLIKQIAIMIDAILLNLKKPRWATQTFKKLCLF